MADNKQNAVFAKSKEQVAAEKAASDAEVVKYKNEALAQRAARFASLGNSVSPTAIRQARQEIIDRKAPLLDPETRGTVKPIDNPIPVRHEGEEPGEPDKGESVELVKIRPDVQDAGERDPEGHAKGLKVLNDGSQIDAEGEKHADQPEGHNPKEKVESAPEGESDEARLERLRQEYKDKFGKPATARWSADHIQSLLDGKV